MVSACSKEEIDSLPESPAIDLGIVGHSVPEEEQFGSAADVRLRWPGAKILFLLRDGEAMRKISSDQYKGPSEISQ